MIQIIPGHANVVGGEVSIVYSCIDCLGAAGEYAISHSIIKGHSNNNVIYVGCTVVQYRM